MIETNPYGVLTQEILDEMGEIAGSENLILDEC